MTAAAMPATLAPIDAAAADAAAARLRRWLLSESIQLRDGEHAGGIVGALDAQGRARYVYPEITGYYLHWLAEVGDAADRAQRSDAAARAADWARRQLADGRVPATRAYLIDAESDWRNDAVFFFDLAMLLRGLTAAAEADLIPPPAPTLTRLVAELQRFVGADGEIHAARELKVGASLPGRWSTWGGPFEVKASSRVALAARHLQLPADLAGACAALAAHYAPATAELPLEMLHPTLYYAEGLLVAHPQRAPDVARLLGRLLALAAPDGSLPEAEHDSNVPRSDIVAQALRVGLLLRDANVAGAPDAATLARLAANLIPRLRADGSLPFRVDVPDPQPNAWCSMFAEQALRWYARHLRGERLPAAEWLV